MGSLEPTPLTLNERPVPEHGQDQDAAVPDSGNNVLSHFSTWYNHKKNLEDKGSSSIRETGTNSVFLVGAPKHQKE